MKNLITCLLILISGIVRGQVPVKEGKVIFEIQYSNLPAEIERNKHLLPREAVFYFKGSRTRMEMKVGLIGKNSTLRDTATHLNTILLYIYEKKFALIKHDSELHVLRDPLAVRTVTKITITDTTKKIAGFPCRKAIVHMDTLIRECWFTEYIPPYTTREDLNLKSINGFLMEFSSEENGVMMTMRAKLVQAVPLDEKLFTIPDDYKVVTEDELNLLMQVMQEDRSGN